MYINSPQPSLAHPKRHLQPIKGELERASVWGKVVWTLRCAASSDGAVQQDVAPPMCSAFHLSEMKGEGKD